MTRFARMQGVGGWTTAAASLLLAGICAGSPSAPAVKLKPVEWARAFPHPEPFVQTERLYAFSASPPAKIVVGLATGPAEAQSTRIVVAEPSGRNARRIPGGINGWIESLQPSPDGTKLACVSKPSHSYPVTAGARLSVLDVRTGASTLISTSDAWAPEWSADGRSLFFWQRAGGMEAQWQPFCAEPAAKGAGPKAASDLMGEEPGVFSRNARHAAALGEGVATVEDLLTRRRTSYELPVALSEGKVLWSWDSERLILHGAVRGALHWARYGSYVINRSTRSVDSLLAQLGLSLIHI